MSEWQPVETAPNAQYILLCIFPVYRCFVGLKSIDGSFRSIVGQEDGYPIKLGPTHWQPLPAAPEYKEGEE